MRIYNKFKFENRRNSYGGVTDLLGILAKLPTRLSKNTFQCSIL